MTCRARDQDLLLLAHGALPAPRRLLTELHLRRCRQCRDRQRQLAAASVALAGAIRDPGQVALAPSSPTAGAHSTCGP